MKHGMGMTRLSCMQPVAALVMPRDDLVKAYLLDGPGRYALAARGGGTYQTLAGPASLFPLLSDRGFVCLHYRLAPSGLLEPCRVPANLTPGSATGSPELQAQCVGQAGEGCRTAERRCCEDVHAVDRASGAGLSCGLEDGSHTTAEPATDVLKAAEPGARPGPAVAESDVQIGLHVRKGVGGTCPARAVARRLSTEGLLPALLDPCPYLMGPVLPLPAGAASALPSAAQDVTQPAQMLLQPQQAGALRRADVEEPRCAEAGQQPAEQLSPQAHTVLQAPAELCAATAGTRQSASAPVISAAGQQAPANGASALGLRAQASPSEPRGACNTLWAAAQRGCSGQPDSGASAAVAGALCSQAAGHQLSPNVPGLPAARRPPRVAGHGLAGHCDAADAAEDREGLDDLLNELQASPRRALLAACPMPRFFGVLHVANLDSTASSPHACIFLQVSVKIAVLLHFLNHAACACAALRGAPLSCTAAEPLWPAVH